MNTNQEKIKKEIERVSKLGLTDKATYHSYEEIYPKLLERFLGKSLNILEIGIGNGGGLLILSNLFPESKICGVDSNPSNLKISIGETNIRVFQLDQCDPKLTSLFPELDIVIEDASHQYENSIRTFSLLKDNIKKNGIYIIEDVYPQFKHLYELDPLFKIYDLTKNKNRGDDVLAVYEK